MKMYYWILRTTATGAYVLAFIGFMTLSPVADWSSLFSAALRSIQIFFLQLSPAELGNWQTQLASILAPLTTIGAAIAAFGDGLRRWQRKTYLRRNSAEVVYLGSGKTAATLASGALRRQKGRQVGVDLNHATALAGCFSKRSGCFVIEGDATSASTLRELNVMNAQLVWVVAGQDHRNISILQNLIVEDSSYGSDSKKWTSSGTRRWFVDISNRNIVRVASAKFRAPKGVVIEYFNIERIAARRLMRDFANQIFPKISGSLLNSGILHICVLGAEKLAQSIILHSIQQLVLSEKPQDCIRITWIAADANDRLKELKNQFPMLGDDLGEHPAFVGLLPIAKLVAFDSDERSLSAGAWASAQIDFPFTAVYIASVDNLTATGAMLRASALREISANRQFPDQPIVVCYLDPLAPDELQQSIQNVYPNHVLHDIYSTDETYPGEQFDQVAKRVNAFYSWTDKDVGQWSDENFVERKWTSLDESNKWSSRLYADHIAIKMSLIGATGLDEDQQGTTVHQQNKIQENLEWLARLEHRRFTVERLLEDWMPLAVGVDDEGIDYPSGLSYQEQKSCLRLNKTLVPFDALPLEDQSRVRNSVKNLLVM